MTEERPVPGSADAATISTEQELVVSRSFEAPRELVFKAWTEPERLMRWWGPNGFTTPFCTVDLRPGGAFRYCMRSPEGNDYWGIGIYREIITPERIVYTDAFADEAGNVVGPEHYGMSANHPAETLVTVTFAERAGLTTVTVRQNIPASVAEGTGAGQGWGEMLDRLAGEFTHA